MDNEAKSRVLHSYTVPRFPSQCTTMPVGFLRFASNTNGWSFWFQRLHSTRRLRQTAVQRARVAL